MVTFSGSGEPTLAKNLGEAIDVARSFTGRDTVVLTNAAHLDDERVVSDLRKADRVFCKLDAADEERYSEAKRALFSITSRFEVKGVPLLFIANKIDLIDNQQKLGSIESDFSLLDLKEDRKLTIKFMSLVTKQGINEVIDWISDIVSEELIKENGF